MDLRGSESEAASDEAEASDGSGFGDTDEDDTRSDGPHMLVVPPSGAPLGGRVWDSRDEAWSPELRGVYEQAWEGMNKPSWFAYPGSIKKLLLATISLVQHGAVRGEVEQFLRELVPETFAKCYDDLAVYRWADHIQSDVLDMTVALMHLLQARLAVLGATPCDADEDDLVPLLSALAPVFDPDSPFHNKHRADPVPARAAKDASPDTWAQPQPEVESAFAENAAGTFETGKVPAHRWLTHIVNAFGASGCFHSLLQLLEEPQRASLRTLEACLKALAKAAPVLDSRLRESCEAAVNKVLVHAMEMLERPELLAKARDKNLATLSSLVRHAQALLAAIVPPARAARTVIVVQRGLVLSMLQASTFSLQLAGVREINAMLDAAQPPPRPLVGPMPSEAAAGSQEAAEADVEEIAKGAVQWLESEDVLSRTLRSHLHLKQYVEQVERIMRFLLRRGCLRDQHLDIVWSITERQDTFEETKANMYALLAALAVDFSPSQLDSLFARFEHGRDRSAADTIKILQLVTALARGDASGVLAERLTDLLWNQLLVPDAPPEALQTLVDVVNNYAISAPACRATVISRCLDNVAAGASVLPSVRLLRQLLVVAQQIGDGHMTDGPSLQSLVEQRREEVSQLNSSRGVVSLLLSELEQYMASARAAVAAGAAAPPGDGRASHSECLSERLNFLSGLLFAGGIELGVPEVDRLWACFMTGAAQLSDADVLANWLKHIPGVALHGASVLTPDAARHVLSTVGTVPPARLTPALWACMASFVAMVGIASGHMRWPVSNFGDALPPYNPNTVKATNLGVPLTLTLEFEGLARMWDAALEAPSPVCDSAIQWLAWLYPQLTGATPADTLALRQALVSQAEACLNASHAKLVAASADAAPAAAKRVDNVLRLLDIILTHIDATHHAARHAARLAPPVHGATYGGRQVTIEYHYMPKGGNMQQRKQLHPPGNQYAATLRPMIAQGVGAPVERIRMLWAGKDLCSLECAQLPCSRVEGAVINVMVVNPPSVVSVAVGAGGAESDPDTPSMDTEAPSFPVLQPPVAVAAPQDGMLSARQLLAVMPGLYDTLYSLADAGHPALCTHATAILNALPTRAETRAHLESLLPAGGSGPDLAAATADSRRQLSAALSAPPAARAYTLQILEGLMIPVNSFMSDAASAAVVSAFRALGGPQLVLAALSPASLPENIGTVPLRSLFLAGLNLLRLLTGDSDAGPLVRDLGDVDSAADRFAADTVDVLLWLLPRTAMGRLGSSGAGSGAGGDADMAFDDVSSALYALANGDSPLDPNDVYLTIIGLVLLTSALGQRSGGAVRLLGRPDATSVLSDLLLRCPSSLLRETAASMCVDLVSRENPQAAPTLASPTRPAPSSAGGVAAMSGSGGSGAATASGSEDATTAVAATRRAMLGVLLTMRGAADESPASCRSYFELVASLLSGTASSGQDGALLDDLLAEEVRWLTTAEPCTDSLDCRLEGHLSLVISLVRGLRRRSVTTENGYPLLSLLLRVFLFPELSFLERDQVDPDLDDDAVLLTARASTPRTRTQAFNLVIALATHDAVALSEVLHTLRTLHFDTDTDSLARRFSIATAWERMPQYTSRRDNSFVGLCNGGATCYMNSVFQQLFMQPSIRRNVLSAVDATDAQPADSVLCQLQATFGALHASRLDHHRPEAFWQAFKDYDGQPVNVREHQDALEFLSRLQEQVDAAVKPPTPPGAPPPADGAPAGPPQPLEQVLGGMLVNQIVCRTCPQHRSEKDESFTSLPVDIRNKSGLVESLTSFVQGELLEGDNQWVCEACGHKVDAVKRQSLKTLPQMLCIQLKRFEYDYETMQRLKVKDRFEFPTELDMRPFTREGVDEAEAPPAAPGPPDDKYAYTLMGVVVHSGSAFAGHYYSYIRERLVAADGSVAAGSWHVFDDKRVEPYDAANLERDTFGGKYSMEGWDHIRKMNAPIEYDRPNSAYMLFYERLGDPPPEPAGDVAMDGSAAGAAQLAVRLPPRVAAEVRAANAQCVYESHLFSRDYFAFVRGLVDANVEYSRKRRREAPAAPQGNVVAPPSAEVLCCELAASFLMMVYSRAAGMLREDSAAWVASVTSLLESSQTACCWFLHWLTDPVRKNQVRIALCRAQGEDVRELWWKLSSGALRVAGLHDPQAVNFNTLYDHSQDEDFDGLEVAMDDLPALVHAYVVQVIEYLEPPAPTRTRAGKDAHLEAILLVLFEYAKLGPVQRAHLVVCEAPHSLAEFAIHRLNPYSPPRMENTGSVGNAVHVTMAAMLRGAGGPYYPKKGPNAPQNPYALGSGAGQCPPLVEHVFEWSRTYRDKYFPLLVEISLYSEDVTQLLCYLTWCQHNESRLVIDALLEEYHQIRAEDTGALGGLLRVTETLLAMADGHLQNQRLALFLHGETGQRAGGVVQNDPPLPGFLDLMVSPTTPLPKRFCLLRWVVASHDAERPNFWQNMADACQQPLLRAADMVYEDFERNRQAQPGTYIAESLNPVIVRIRQICEPVYD